MLRGRGAEKSDQLGGGGRDQPSEDRMKEDFAAQAEQIPDEHGIRGGSPAGMRHGACFVGASGEVSAGGPGGIHVLSERLLHRLAEPPGKPLFEMRLPAETSGPTSCPAQLASSPILLALRLGGEVGALRRGGASRGRARSGSASATRGASACLSAMPRLGNRGAPCRIPTTRSARLSADLLLYLPRPRAHAHPCPFPVHEGLPPAPPERPKDLHPLRPGRSLPAAGSGAAEAGSPSGPIPEGW
jgi:hypothetical protein